MLTLFTTGKPFHGHSGVIQRNALKSWTLLHPDVEVILFGDEEGVGEVCAEYGLRHEPHVERHESGMKYLDYMFGRAQQIARHEYLCYANCDIVLMKDFREAFERTLAWRRRFLLVGQRWDTDVTQPIEFADEDWEERLREFAQMKGQRQHTDFADFFVFSKGLYDQVPPLVVGRSAWDAWLIWKGLSEGAAVVDCSRFVVAVHQNHGYGYHPQGKQGTNDDALALRNRELSGNGRHLRTIMDATHRLTKHGSIRWSPVRRYLPKTAMEKFWQALLVRTFPLRAWLGLRKETLGRLYGQQNKSVDQTRGSRRGDNQNGPRS
jgi:hypothetical protein